MERSDLEYVVKGALMMCDKGAAPNKFTPTHNTTFKADELLVATNEDTIPIDNIPFFFICEKTGAICVPETEPLSWVDTAPVKTKDGVEVLWAKSTCPCKVGGTIEFYTSGQMPLDDEDEELLKEMQDEAKEALSDAGYGDSVGEPGFWESFIPIWGSLRSAINNGQQGRWGWAIFDGGMAVFEGFTLGIGSLIKNGLKKIGGGAIKAIGKNALSRLGKQGLRDTFSRLSKSMLRKNLSSKATAKNIVTSIGCFVAGTQIHTQNGLKSIENIKTGDLVWAFNEDTCEISLKKVLNTMVRQSDHTIKIHTEHEIIETTKVHPFYINGKWIEAFELKVNDNLLTKDGIQIPIKSIEYCDQPKKVYNFEVEGWHTYFVGFLMLLVHNATKCVTESIKNLYGAIDKSLEHIFSAKHIKGGIMDLGKNRKDILSNLTSKIKNVNADGLLKEGANQIKTTINGIEAEIRIYIKNGETLSVDLFKGHSSRNMGTTIIYP